MKIVDFLQENDLFFFNRLKCLRNEYYYNECRECIEICPENAIDIPKKRINLDGEKCIGCGICVGVCPSEALGSKNFDVNEFVKIFSKSLNSEISCKKNTPCLSVFDVHHYIYLALQKEEVVCDLSECDGCVLNKEGEVKKSIQNRISLANEFLKTIESNKEIKTKKETKTLSRRELFGNIFKEIKNFEFEDLKEEMQESKYEAKITQKLLLLKSALKEFLQKSSKSKFIGKFPFIVEKEINDRCTNCSECVQFCPTGALFYSSDSSKIFFQSGKCINCSICDDICKERAIFTKDKEDFDLLKFAFDRAEILASFKLEICKVCKCAFAYKEGDKICPRCASFENQFSDIFKLACEKDSKDV